MKIIRGAAHLALDENIEHMELKHLAKSFNENGVLNIDNPFFGNAPGYPLPPLISDNPAVKGKGRRK